MVIPSGTVRFSDIQTELGGGNPISLSEYYGCNATITLPTKFQPINVGIFRGLITRTYRLSYGTFDGVDFVTTNVYRYSINGTLVLTASGRFDILVVGGGGGGGGRRGGGGGGGGIVYYVNVRLNAGTYNITIGGGGGGGGTYGGDGGNTDVTFNSSLLYRGNGGGGGGGGDQYGGRDGGSGGGGGGGYSWVPGGSLTQGTTFWDGSTYIDGGSHGSSCGSYYGANGGGGKYVNITGTNEYYGGGGGGGTTSRGALGSTYGGGGGGGQFDGGYDNAGSGSSGVVIFKYLGA